MKLFHAVAGSCAAFLGLAAVTPAHAGWQSAFQVACFHRSPSASYYGPAYDPCCDPCPQPVVTTRYVQRCYYQPVTTYQTRTYYQPVTTYRTSYYYDPVTSYRYSCYFDPCTCSYRQVATPVTRYCLRAQCCPVTSWVQRCCTVPVVSYRQCCYWEAQSCYVDPCAPFGAAAVAAPASPSPGVIEGRSRPVEPGVQERRNGGSGSPLYDQRYPVTPGREGSGSSLRHQTQKVPAPAAKPKAPVVIDRIAFDREIKGEVSSPVDANLEGRIVQEDNRPQIGARLVFISETLNHREVATADEAGRFRVQLPAGGWSLYLRREGHMPVLLSKLQVRGSEVQQMTLVSR